MRGGGRAVDASDDRERVRGVALHVHLLGVDEYRVARLDVRPGGDVRAGLRGVQLFSQRFRG